MVILQHICKPSGTFASPPSEIFTLEIGYVFSYKINYGFAFLGVFVVSYFVVGLCLFLPLGSIILFGDRSRLFNLGIFVRALLFLRS